jgi:hypothetical protein
LLRCLQLGIVIHFASLFGTWYCHNFCFVVCNLVLSYTSLRCLQLGIVIIFASLFGTWYCHNVCFVVCNLVLSYTSLRCLTIPSSKQRSKNYDNTKFQTTKQKLWQYQVPNNEAKVMTIPSSKQRSKNYDNTKFQTTKQKLWQYQVPNNAWYCHNFCFVVWNLVLS